MSIVRAEFNLAQRATAIPGEVAMKSARLFNARGKFFSRRARDVQKQIMDRLDDIEDGEEVLV